jgi:hypothetical protein
MSGSAGREAKEESWVIDKFALQRGAGVVALRVRGP